MTASTIAYMGIGENTSEPIMFAPPQPSTSTREQELLGRIAEIEGRVPRDEMIEELRLRVERIATLESQLAAAQAQLEARQGKVVAWMSKSGRVVMPDEKNYLLDNESLGGEFKIAANAARSYGTPLYLAPPEPSVSVPDEMPTKNCANYMQYDYAKGWNACRAATLASLGEGK